MHATKPGLRGLLPLLVALLCISCGHAPAVDTSPPTPKPASSATIKGWISAVEQLGIRRPGYAADDRTEEWLREQFIALGLRDVKLDPIEVLRWEPKHWSLQVWRDGDEAGAIAIDSWPIPLSANAENLVGELILTPKPGAGERGKLAVVELGLLSTPQSRMRDQVATWAYDPGREFDTLTQVWPLGPRFSNVMEPDIESGAKGFIGILDFPWQTDHYFVPYDAVPRSIPGLYLSRANGDRLKALMAGGYRHARINLLREQVKARSHNVIAVLPGRTDEWVVIGSHHDGPWNSAVEDASGVALVLAQAHYWAQVPREQRPHNLMFLLNGGHMSGGAGLIHFANSQASFLKEKVVAEVHLEHAAREAKVVDGHLVPTERPEVRWWFTSFIPRLEESVARAICAEHLDRSLIMPVEGFPSPASKHPPTDAAFFHPLTPIVSFLTAPMYLFDPADRLNMIHEPSLLPLTRAVISIIEDLGRTSVVEIRQGIYAPPRRTSLPSCAGLATTNNNASAQ